MGHANIFDDFQDIRNTLYMYERGAILLHSWESMEILDEMLASFHHTFSFFPLPEELPMLTHSVQDLTESRFIVSCEEAPGVTEACSSYHESI